MSKKLLFVFSLLAILYCAPRAQAGFWVSKHTAPTPAAARATGTAAPVLQQLKALAELQQNRHAAGQSFNGYRVMGWLAILSLICGIMGFFYPGFSIAAVLFGLFGLSRYNRKKGLAVAGLILGLVVIGLIVFTTFEGFAFF